MSDLFPPIDPHLSGLLEVGHGHQIYYEVSGNPHGQPILFVHGGPGAGTQPLYRRFFDPKRWRIVLFDQRGCGRSLPAACIDHNTTPDLVSDMEQLRQHLNIHRWLLFGGSWGSTLALAYGQAYPERVTGFILRGIFLCRPAEIQWFLYGMGQFFPEIWQRFRDHLPMAEQTDLLAHYARRLNHPDPTIHLPAALAWYHYEEACAHLLPSPGGSDPSPAQVLALARLECHYMRHNGFLDPNQLLQHMSRIQHLPAIIVQGRYDVICPPVSAFELADRWPQAQLQIVANAGHSSHEPGIRHALLSSLNQPWPDLAL